MAWSFRKRIKIIPGVHINVSKHGVSTSIGIRGASLTFRDDGIYSNLGIPGTGIYKREKIWDKNQFPQDTQNNDSPIIPPHNSLFLQSADEYFISSDPLEITSEGLQGIQETVLFARQQEEELKNDLRNCASAIGRTKSCIFISKALLIYFFSSNLRRKLENDLSHRQKAYEEIKEGVQNSSVKLEIDMDEDARNSYQGVCESFKTLMLSQFKWDVTSSTRVDQVKTRSAAYSSIGRRNTNIGVSQIPGISSSLDALKIHNTTGADIYLYPGFFVMYKSHKNIGIVGLNELSVQYESSHFIETGTLPKDSELIYKVWEKSNKDGSRDKRFSNNRQIPVMEYGVISFTTETGVNERYMFSNAASARAFVSAFTEFKSLVF